MAQNILMSRRRRWCYSFIIVSIMFIFVPAVAVLADASSHGKPLEEVLSEIRGKLGLASGERIDPDRVSDADLEEVGEAVMSVMHPDPRQHELIDQMMGGEGSPSLAAMHRMMGYNYLAGGMGSPYSGGGWGGMMAPGMMGGGMMGRGAMGWGMMGPGMMGGRWGGPMGGFPFGGIVMWIIIVALIVVVVYLVVRVRRGAGTSGWAAGGRQEGETPLQIVQKRFARGEISKEEYDSIRSAL
jgi:uncharacterized membrane protein